MRKTRRFIIICVFFAIASLFFSLICSAAISREDQRASEAYELLKKTENDITVLEIKLETRLSLSELEQIARNELFMEKLSPENIVIAELPSAKS